MRHTLTLMLTHPFYWLHLAVSHHDTHKVNIRVKLVTIELSKYGEW